MTAHRFFLTGHLSGNPDQRIPLTDADVHHATVLRVRPGEEIDVVDSDGRVWRVAVTRCSAAGVFGRVTGQRPAREQPRVTLFQAVAKGEKMDDIIRQAVEIGAEEIVPVLSSRCVVKLDRRKRTDRGERWRRVAAAAAKQAKRAAVPDVADPIRLVDAVSRFSEYDKVLVPWEEQVGSGLVTVLETLEHVPSTRLALVIGPEGGFGADEIEQLMEAGAQTVSLGANILRTETASLVALTLVMAALGGVGGRDVCR